MKIVVPSGLRSRSLSKVVIRPLPTGPSVDAPWLRHWRKNVESITHVDLSALRSDMRVNDMTEKHVPGSLLARVSKAIDELTKMSFKRYEQHVKEEMKMAAGNTVVGVGRPMSPESYSDFDPLGREGPRRPLSQQITVTDVCELAKAGVKMDVNDVTKLLAAPSIYQNPPKPTGPHPYDMSLEDRIIHRWQSTRIHSSNNGIDGRNFRTVEPGGLHEFPFTIGKVLTHGDKQYVFVQKAGNPPCTIEDDCALFPSDNLLNSLRLMDKALPDAPMSGSGGQVGGAMPTAGNAAGQKAQQSPRVLKP